MNTSLVIYLGVLLLIAAVIIYVMLKGARAVNRMGEERREQMKREEESRKVILKDGTVFYTPGPPTPPKSEVFKDAGWGGIDLPPDHYP